MISQTIIWFTNNVVLPAMLLDASAAMPVFGVVLGLPIIGPATRQVIQWFIDKALNAGIITIKTDLISILSASAKAKYAPQIAILQAAQSQDSLTPDQEANYVQALQNAVANRPGVVNS